MAYTKPVVLPPGWLARDIAKAVARLAEWQRKPRATTQPPEDGERNE